jgi:aconitate decarboxylase
MTSYTRQIADYAASLKLSDVPQDVIARAKGVMLDGLGCGLYGSDVTWTRILAGVVKRLEPKGGQASIWGCSQTASAVNAALVNGTMVQGYELDDVHINGALHTCSIVLPAAFAAAEYVGADKVSGEKLLTSIIAGFEIGPRIGKCMRGEAMLFNGWHSGAIIAPFPGTITAGVVLGLNAEQFFHAMGIAGTQACGLMAAQYGSMVKRMQHAKGAQSGLYGAMLAADGFTGIEDVFEEKYGGFCSTFSHSTDAFDLPALVEGLGKSWETMMFTIKTYACRGGNHSAVNAIDELVTETGLKAEDVEEITVRVTEAMVKHAGWHPYVPKGLTAAQMHTGFCIATRLIEGDVFVDQMIEENVARPDLVELANRVHVVRDEKREKMGNDYRKGSDILVKLKNGKVLNKIVDFPLGSDRRPLTSEQMAKKFRRLAAKVLPKRKVSQIEKLVWDLENVPSVTPLIKALRKR